MIIKSASIEYRHLENLILFCYFVQVQTDFQPCAENKFITTIVDADSINHIVVFLTGTQAFHPGTGGLGIILLNYSNPTSCFAFI